MFLNSSNRIHAFPRRTDFLADKLQVTTGDQRGPPLPSPIVWPLFHDKSGPCSSFDETLSGSIDSPHSPRGVRHQTGAMYTTGTRRDSAGRQFSLQEDFSWPVASLSSLAGQVHGVPRPVGLETGVYSVRTRRTHA